MARGGSIKIRRIEWRGQHEYGISWSARKGKILLAKEMALKSKAAFSRKGNVRTGEKTS